MEQAIKWGTHGNRENHKFANKQPIAQDIYKASYKSQCPSMVQGLEFICISTNFIP